MASACVNNIGLSPESFLDCPASYPSYGWLSPRISFSREISDNEASKVPGVVKSSSQSASEAVANTSGKSDPDISGKEVGDFEFRLEDPMTMLPADELFLDGKLMPLQLSMSKPAVSTMASTETSSPVPPKSRRRMEISTADPYLFSPKAPRCSSRWKGLLGLKKLYQNNNAKQENHKTNSSVLSNSNKSLKSFLQRSSKSSSSSFDSSLSVPLLKDSDNESISLSSRLSLSSSSSGHEHDDLPSRLSLDSEKPRALSSENNNLISLTRIQHQNQNQNSNPPRTRTVKPRALSSENPTAGAARVGRSPMRRAPDSSTNTARGVSVDSPRMNSSGKIVFHSLERSSSSPSSYGGPRFKHRGMERSYSANVRVTPVLNVPVCSLRGSSKSGVFGFPLFSSPQKRDGVTSTINGGGGGSKGQLSSKNRTNHQ